jgi:hypothetical protein
VATDRISAWLAERVSPGGKAVAFDLDLSLIEVRAPNLELRQGDIVAGPVERGSFDLMTARAVLHHVADAEAAIKNLVASRAARGTSILGGLARVVARTRDRLSRRAHPGTKARSTGFDANKRHCGNGDLQRRLAMGRLLDADDHRTSR